MATSPEPALGTVFLALSEEYTVYAAYSTLIEAQRHAAAYLGRVRVVAVKATFEKP